ncbi:hypothetical protein D3C74_502020 [compost metagenome]
MQCLGITLGVGYQIAGKSGKGIRPNRDFILAVDFVRQLAAAQLKVISETLEQFAEI